MEEYDHPYGGGGLRLPAMNMMMSSSTSTFAIQTGVEQHHLSDHQLAVVKAERGSTSDQSASTTGKFHPIDHDFEQQGEGGININIVRSVETIEGIKAKITAHPQYPNLLEAYIDCQRVGAPPEVVARLEAARQEFEEGRLMHHELASTSSTSGSVIPKLPELDQFMEAYYDMLVKYREELRRPLEEAMEFMRRIETQLNFLITNNNGPPPPPHLRTFNSAPPPPSDEKWEGGVGSSEEEQGGNSGGEAAAAELPEIDPRAEDRELKNHLLRKYSGYLSSLKQELSKKKKKGKLPKEARQKLLGWWDLHYRWPYPSESQKVGLAESTGLDQKQINNWFINQRKRHWKPAEDMHLMAMDGLHHQNAAAAFYMDGHHHHYMADESGPYRLGP